MCEQPSKSGISFRHLAIMVTLSLVAALVLWVGSKVSRIHAFQAEFKRGRSMIQSLENRKPIGASKGEWKFVAFPWATYVYGSAFSNPFNTNVDVMRRFNDNLEEKLDGEVRFDVFDWIWDGLGEATPAGKRYKKQFYPQYREILEAVRKEDAKPEPVKKREGKE